MLAQIVIAGPGAAPNKMANKRPNTADTSPSIDDNNIIYEVIDYLNISPEESFLKSVILKLEINFQEIIRVNEKIYKNLNVNEKKHTFENIINLVMKYPILLERPIVSIERNKITIACKKTIKNKRININNNYFIQLF